VERANAGTTALRRVVVAEDDDDLRTVLARVIDAEPDRACVGPVAGPDVLVLDLVLEGGTSLHLIRRLRDAHPELRIILYSGYVGSVVLGAARERGATACVAKGADYGNLMDAIRGFAPRPGAVAGA
jgi:DNA-binding NarL/FixJ family response regulator